MPGFTAEILHWRAEGIIFYPISSQYEKIIWTCQKALFPKIRPLSDNRKDYFFTYIIRNAKKGERIELKK